MIFLEKTILKELWKPINFGEDCQRINPTIIYKKEFWYYTIYFSELKYFSLFLYFLFHFVGIEHEVAPVIVHIALNPLHYFSRKVCQ